MTVWVLVALWGCQTRTDDQTAYLAALEGPLDGAVAQCSVIADEPTRIDCLLAVAGRAVRGDDAVAEAACRELDGFWAEECWFTAVDRLGWVEEDALNGCKLAGRLEQRCRSHALLRVAREMAEDYPVGEEVAFEAAIRDYCRYYLPEGGPEFRHVVVADVLAQRLTEPLDVTACGSAPEPLCADAFKFHLMRGDLAAYHAHCDDGAPDPDVLADYHVPRWTPASQEVATLAWKLACAQRTIPPEY